jgi:hypothetical protein
MELTSTPQPGTTQANPFPWGPRPAWAHLLALRLGLTIHGKVLVEWEASDSSLHRCRCSCLQASKLHVVGWAAATTAVLSTSAPATRRASTTACQRVDSLDPRGSSNSNRTGVHRPLCPNREE